MTTTRMTMAPLTIAILTNQWLLWLGFQATLERSQTIPMVVHPHRPRTRGTPLSEIQADVFILDVEAERDVLGTIKQIRESAPASKIVLLCGFEDDARTREAFAYGVDGIIPLVQPPPVVLATIQALYAPSHRHPPRAQPAGVGMARLTTTLDSETQPLAWPQVLTKREREIVQLVGQGLSNKDIAYRLSIRDSTVRHHMTSIFDKVGVPNRQKLLLHTHRLASPHPSSHARHLG